MLELEHRLLVLENRLDNLIKSGRVTSINDDKGTVRVEYLESGLVSDELPVLFKKTRYDKEYDLPDVGENVVCLFLPIGLEKGYVLGSFYSDRDVTPVKDRKHSVREYSDGSAWGYDKRNKLVYGIFPNLNLFIRKAVQVSIGALQLIIKTFDLTAQKLVLTLGSLTVTTKGSMSEQIAGAKETTAGTIMESTVGAKSSTIGGARSAVIVGADEEVIGNTLAAKNAKSIQALIGDIEFTATAGKCEFGTDVTGIFSLVYDHMQVSNNIIAVIESLTYGNGGGPTGPASNITLFQPVKNDLTILQSLLASIKKY